MGKRRRDALFYQRAGIGEGESHRRCGYLESIAFGTPRSSSFSGGGSCRLVFYADPYLSSVRPAVRPIVENMEKQKRFVTDAGHEIKTPLAIIMANTDALELHQGETKWSRNIRGQTERLSGLMQNLLTLSRMDEGTAGTLMSECSLSEMTRDAVAQFREPAENRGISVLCDIAENVTVTGDKVRLLQLLTILLDQCGKICGGRDAGDPRICIPAGEDGRSADFKHMLSRSGRRSGKMV